MTKESQMTSASHSDQSALHAKRFEGIVRPYSKADVERLRGSFKIEYTLATLGATRLWELLHTEPYVHALGALTGNRPCSRSAPGLKAIYLSGWQVAADANTAGQMYPDQSLYPADSVPTRGAQDQRRAPARRPDRARRGQARRATGSRRSSPTPRPASAARSTRSS